MLSNIRIVLVNTSHPGNIGAASRAMKTMGLTKLYLVEPMRYPDAEATARASGADDVLAEAVVCRTLEDALQGCQLVMACSARSRNMTWPTLSPRACGERLAVESDAGEVAVVFGRERSGLSNEELERCNYLISIPANAEYSSLNIAAAVQVIAYELFVASQTERQDERDEKRRWVTAEGMSGFYDHLEQTLADVGFFDVGNPKIVMRRLRRLFNRTRLDENEVNILRGMFSAAQRKCSEKNNS